MSTAGRSRSETRSALATSEFVHAIIGPTPADVLTLGILVRGFDTLGVPYHVTVGATQHERRAAMETTSTKSREIVIRPDRDNDQDDSIPLPALSEAVAIVESFGHSLSSTTIGIAALGVGDDDLATTHLEEAVETGELRRRPGLGVPAGIVDGLAHSTLIRGPWSGDRSAAQDLIEMTIAGDPDDASEDRLRTLSSTVAIDVSADRTTSSRSMGSIECFLRPYEFVDGDVATVQGFIDLLNASLRSDPGVAIALASGYDVAETALPIWRRHGQRCHRAIDSASIDQGEGIHSFRIEHGPVESVASIITGYLSAEPLTLVGTDDAFVLLDTEAVNRGDSISTSTHTGDVEVSDAFETATSELLATYDIEFERMDDRLYCPTATEISYEDIERTLREVS